MLTLTIVMLLSAEPAPTDRFLGGAKPTPLSTPGPVDTTPSSQACSTLTLRDSSKCLFDGRPAVMETDAARKKQAKDNVELAKSLGKGMCTERLTPTLEDDKERARRTKVCVDGTTRAAATCSLQGEEVLLDAEGRFSNRAGACYEALATALQLADVPLPEKEAPQAPPAKSRFPTNAL